MADRQERPWKLGVAAYWALVAAVALFGYWLIVSTLF
jgi:hypothetical protein